MCRKGSTRNMSTHKGTRAITTGQDARLSRTEVQPSGLDRHPEIRLKTPSPVLWHRVQWNPGL